MPLAIEKEIRPLAEEHTTKLSFRLNSSVYRALEKCAQVMGYETMAYIQKVLSSHAVSSGHMTDYDASKISSTDELIELAVKKSRTLYDHGLFTEDFVLTVFQHLMMDTEFRPKYEKLIGGAAFTSGLPGKSPLNMYLGWHIKNAVGADPKMMNGKPVRVQVKNEPIQSYTRLVRANL